MLEDRFNAERFGVVEASKRNLRGMQREVPSQQIFSGAYAIQCFLAFMQACRSRVANYAIMHADICAPV
jgi:hypothetical protein